MAALLLGFCLLSPLLLHLLLSPLLAVIPGKAAGPCRWSPGPCPETPSHPGKAGVLASNSGSVIRPRCTLQRFPSRPECPVWSLVIWHRAHGYPFGPLCTEEEGATGEWNGDMLPDPAGRSRSSSGERGVVSPVFSSPVQNGKMRFVQRTRVCARLPSCLLLSKPDTRRVFVRGHHRGPESEALEMARDVRGASERCRRPLNQPLSPTQHIYIAKQPPGQLTWGPHSHLGDNALNSGKVATGDCSHLGSHIAIDLRSNGCNRSLTMTIGRTGRSGAQGPYTCYLTSAAAGSAARCYQSLGITEGRMAFTGCYCRRTRDMPAETRDTPGMPSPGHAMGVGQMMDGEKAEVNKHVNANDPDDDFASVYLTTKPKVRAAPPQKLSVLTGREQTSQSRVESKGLPWGSLPVTRCCGLQPLDVGGGPSANVIGPRGSIAGSNVDIQFSHTTIITDSLCFLSNGRHTANENIHSISSTNSFSLFHDNIQAAKLSVRAANPHPQSEPAHSESALVTPVMSSITAFTISFSAHARAIKSGVTHRDIVTTNHFSFSIELNLIKRDDDSDSYSRPGAGPHHTSRSQHMGSAPQARWTAPMKTFTQDSQSKHADLDHHFQPIFFGSVHNVNNNNNIRNDNQNHNNNSNEENKEENVLTNDESNDADSRHESADLSGPCSQTQQGSFPEECLQAACAVDSLTTVQGGTQLKSSKLVPLQQEGVSLRERHMVVEVEPIPSVTSAPTTPT